MHSHVSNNFTSMSKSSGCLCLKLNEHNRENDYNDYTHARTRAHTYKLCLSSIMWACARHALTLVGRAFMLQLLDNGFALLVAIAQHNVLTSLSNIEMRCQS